jgi:hypothetical protein
LVGISSDKEEHAGRLALAVVVPAVAERASPASAFPVGLYALGVSGFGLWLGGSCPTAASSASAIRGGRVLPDVLGRLTESRSAHAADFQ